jgi:hypothetical protein
MRVVAQPFEFQYTYIGLGSNLYSPPYLSISITDTLLTWFTYEKLEVEKESWSFEDSSYGERCYAYKTAFRPSSRDSIVNLLKGKEGKYIFNSNTHIMSGGVHEFHFTTAEWCTTFRLKNTVDSTTVAVCKILNTYLPANRSFAPPRENWDRTDTKPLIQPCGNNTKTYFELLKDEYELIRKSKKQ